GVPDEGVGAEGEDGVVERAGVLEADPPSGEPVGEVEAVGAVGGGPEHTVGSEGEVVEVEAAVADALPLEPLPRQREVLRTGEGDATGHPLRHHQRVLVSRRTATAGAPLPASAVT